MNTGGPAFPVPDTHHPSGQVQFGTNGMTLLDWFAGQALEGFLASPESRMPFDVVHKLAYDHAYAMLAEKARREAVVKESSTTDHSGEANKMVEDHFPDATKMTKLEARNRELVDALQGMVNLLDCIYNAREDVTLVVVSDARAVLAKHKETKP